MTGGFKNVAFDPNRVPDKDYVALRRQARARMRQASRPRPRTAQVMF